MLIVWILFNPIFPIYSSKGTWIVLDIISGVIMLTVSGIFMGKQIKENYETSLFVLRGKVVNVGKTYCHVTPGKNILYFIDIDTKNSDPDIKEGDYIEVQGRLKWVHNGEITNGSIKKGRCYYPRRQCGTFF